jgi:hypothetical protein
MLPLRNLTLNPHHRYNHMYRHSRIYRVRDVVSVSRCVFERLGLVVHGCRLFCFRNVSVSSRDTGVSVLACNVSFASMYRVDGAHSHIQCVARPSPCNPLEDNLFRFSKILKLVFTINVVIAIFIITNTIQTQSQSIYLNSNLKSIFTHGHDRAPLEARALGCSLLRLWVNPSL